MVGRQIAGLVIRAYENALVSEKKGRLLSFYFWGGGYVCAGWFIGHKSESYSGVRGISIDDSKYEPDEETLR